jgi:hypothetical protein
VIGNSLEWNKLENTLRHRARGLVHSRDITKMIENISSSIRDLSRAEISARRGRYSATDALLVKINIDIKMVEEYILVAALLG